MINSINIDAYPKLRQAVIEIAYDNGCVNRAHSENEVVENAFDALAAEFDPSELRRVDEHLATLTPEQLEELCCGEPDDSPSTELEELVERILTHAFENLL